MKMQSKIALGIATAFHFVCAFIFLPAYLGYDVMKNVFNIKLDTLPIIIGILIACVLNAFFLAFPLLYIMEVTHQKWSNIIKSLWIVFIVLFSYIAMPVYWYFYIWKNPKATA